MSYKTSVKAQFTTGSSVKFTEFKKQKSTIDTAKGESQTQIKRTIFKSLILASLILCLEVVLYLAWPK